MKEEPTSKENANKIDETKDKLNSTSSPNSLIHKVAFDNTSETQLHNIIKTDINPSITVEGISFSAIEFVNLKSLNLLTGRMISPSLEAFLKERETLIEFDDSSLKLTPIKNKEVKTFKFKDESEFRDKQTYFEKLGFGVSAEISSWPVFNASGQYDQARVENTNMGKFDGCFEVQTIELLSVKLEESHVRISSLALKQLRQIHRVLVTKSLEEAYQESIKFFEKFGSAVNLGRHFFGRCNKLNIQVNQNEKDKEKSQVSGIEAKIDSFNNNSQIKIGGIIKTECDVNEE